MLRAAGQRAVCGAAEFAGGGSIAARFWHRPNLGNGETPFVSRLFVVALHLLRLVRVSHSVALDGVNFVRSVCHVTVCQWIE